MVLKSISNLFLLWTDYKRHVQSFTQYKMSIMYIDVKTSILWLTLLTICLLDRISLFYSPSRRYMSSVGCLEFPPQSRPDIFIPVDQDKESWFIQEKGWLEWSEWLECCCGGMLWNGSLWLFCSIDNLELN